MGKSFEDSKQYNCGRADALDELERFQTDRKLHERPFNLRVCCMNFFEEMLEMHGVGDSDNRLLSINIYDHMKEVIELVKTDSITIYKSYGITYKEPDENDFVDGLCDIQVFSGGDVNKLGYSNKKCLL